LRFLSVLLHLGELEKLRADGEINLPRNMHKLSAQYLYPYAFESYGDPLLTTKQIDKEQYIFYVLMFLLNHWQNIFFNFAGSC
jgi:hypothetical protein